MKIESTLEPKLCKRGHSLLEVGVYVWSRAPNKVRCKACMTENQKTLRASKEHKEWSKEYSKSNISVQHRRQYLYSLTEQQYNTMLIQQGGVCKTCGKMSKNRRLSIDHDHSCCSGKRSCGKCVRGLICHNCNVILGLAKDSSSLLIKLAEYVSKGNNN